MGGDEGATLLRELGAEDVLRRRRWRPCREPVSSRARPGRPLTRGAQAPASGPGGRLARAARGAGQTRPHGAPIRGPLRRRTRPEPRFSATVQRRLHPSASGGVRPPRPAPTKRAGVSGGGGPRGCAERSSGPNRSAPRRTRRPAPAPRSGALREAAAGRRRDRSDPRP